MPPVGPDDIGGGAVVGPDAVPFGHAPLPFPPLKIQDTAVGVVLCDIVDRGSFSVTGEDLEGFQLVMEAGLQMAGFEIVIVLLGQGIAFGQRAEPNSGENEDHGQKDRGDGFFHGRTPLSVFPDDTMGM